MEIFFTSKFAREYKKSPIEVKKTAEELENIFRKDPFDPKLKTHRLHGKLARFLSFSVGSKYRIIFEFSKDREVVYFHAIGNHDIYQ